MFCFLLYIEPFLALKRNFKIDIRQSLYSRPDAIEFLINMIFIEASKFVAKVLVTNVLSTVTNLAKLTDN